MKYLLLFILLAVVFYKLTGRRNARPAEQQKTRRAARTAIHGELRSVWPAPAAE